MASTKAKGSTKNGRDSQSKRLGVKIYGGEKIKKGMIIIRQRGSRYYVGNNVMLGGDGTIYAIADGVVSFKRKAVKSFSGNRRQKVFVSVTS